MVEEVQEPIVEEDGTPAIFLRKVDVIIQNGEDEEPIVIKANPEENNGEENATEEGQE